MKRVLLVCHANVSRSVIAEKVLQRLLAARGLDRRGADNLAPPLGGPVVEVRAVAKRDLRAGKSSR